jgi:hypothetical protein
MVDWTIHRYDGYVATDHISFAQIVAVDLSSINEFTDRFSVGLDIVVLSMRHRASEGGAASVTVHTNKWGNELGPLASGTVVKVGADAINAIQLATAGTSLLIRVQATNTFPTQHQAIIIARALEAEYP